jgi:hypothetical protein
MNTQLVPVPVSTADITLDQGSGGFTGSISLTGFPPNSSIQLIRVYSPGGDLFVDPFVTTDATGAFVDRGLNFCFDPRNTSVEVTATDGAEVSVTESSPLSCGT